MAFEFLSLARAIGVVCLSLLCVAGCADTASRPNNASAAAPAPFCSGDAARQCDSCVNACSESMCTLNRDQCDPRGVPLNLPFASMYRRCASDCSNKVNGLKSGEATAPATSGTNGAPPPCICRQPPPIPGAF